MKAIKYLRRKWWFKLVSKPDIYLKALIVSAFGVGVLTAILFAVFIYYGGHVDQQTIPPSFHSILGVVLGLLLVFRTNTAYERWWKGREFMSRIEMNYLYMKSKIEILHENFTKQQTLDCLLRSLDILEGFLVKDNGKLKQEYLKQIHSLQKASRNQNLEIDAALRDTLDTFTSLERIKNTPIPQSYSLHIKVSILLYFVTLPFGILSETGYWSILLVMILYYVVAGIEIISNEIENPFYGDPNDLPVKSYIAELKEQIK